VISRRSALGFGAALACGVFVVVLRANALAAAREDADRERQFLEQTAADLREWSDLRTQREVVSAAKRPTQDVIAQVNAVLREIGIPTERLKGLEPESDVALAGRYRTQTIRLALEKVTLREVGSFLLAWRSAKTVWTPRSIELTQVADKDNSSGSLDARLVIAATYLSDAPKEPPR
jgi:hypothetical protein